MMGKRRAPSYERIKARYGYVFLSLWLVGIVLFFLVPFIQTVLYSFSDMTIEPGNVILEPVGFANYVRAFLDDVRFLPAFTESLSSVLLQSPLILILSLFLAILLNQKFRGRTVVRAIFFLPVIITSGVIISIISSDGYLGTILSGQRASMMFEASSIRMLLMDMGLDAIVVDYIVNTVNQIFNLSWRSGIQILIFLAGLQSIPVMLYEVSRVEGATAWETFWKITFPLVAPMILVNLVYTLVDNFINYSNPMFRLVQQISGRIEFDYAAALSIMNFLVLFLLVAIVYLLLNKRIYSAV